MIATDPLSLVFLGCMLFSAFFLLVSAVSGTGHAQIGHVGHIGAAGHVASPHAIHAGAGHAPAGHAVQAGHAAQATPSAHAAAANGLTGAAAPPASPWSAIASTLLASLNVFSVLTFVFFFGLLGYLLHTLTDVAAGLAILLPILFGAAGAVGVGSVLGRLFGRDAGVLTLEDSRLEGRIGRISMAIRPGGVGEAIIQNANGGHQSIGARALDGAAIPVDTDIVVVNVRDGIADVQTWEGFMRSVRSGELPELPPLPASPVAPDQKP